MRRMIAGLKLDLGSILNICLLFYSNSQRPYMIPSDTSKFKEYLPIKMRYDGEILSWNSCYRDILYFVLQIFVFC